MAGRDDGGQPIQGSRWLEHREPAKWPGCPSLVTQPHLVSVATLIRSQLSSLPQRKRVGVCHCSDACGGPTGPAPSLRPAL